MLQIIKIKVLEHHVLGTGSVLILRPIPALLDLTGKATLYPWLSGPAEQVLTTFLSASKFTVSVVFITIYNIK